MTRSLTLLLLLFVALAPAARAAPPGFFGVMTDGTLLDRPDSAFAHEFDVMGSSGVQTIRPVLYWADIEPTKGGPLDWRATDRVFAQAARKRMRVLPVVLRAPAWARVSEANFASPPRDPATFGAFLSKLVGRYGPQGSFWSARPKLPRNVQRTWEIWNEPNLDRYWSSPEPFAKRFVALQGVAYRAIKGADAGATVVLAAMGNDSWRALAAAYAGGLRGSTFDAVALHPFSGRLANVLKIVKLNRDALAKHGDLAKPLYISEITWPSAKGKTKNTTGFETTETGQATRLRNAYTAFLRMRASWRIRTVVWSTWLTPDMGSPNSFDWSGLRRLDPADPSGEPIVKPALVEFRKLANR